MINTYSIIIWISVIFIASLALVIFFGGKDSRTRVFGMSMISVALLNAGIAYYSFVTDFETANFGIRLIFLLGIIAPLSLLYFVLTIKNNRPPGFIYSSLSILLIVGMWFLIFKTNLITGDPIKYTLTDIPIIWLWTYGQWAILNALIAGISFFLCILVLHKRLRTTSPGAERGSIKLILAGFYIGGLTTIAFNTVLPMFELYRLIWLGPATGIIWATIIAFSIAKYNNLNIRVVATEVIIITMSIIGFVYIFFSEFLGLGGRIFIFGAFFILGIFMIRGSMREAAHQEVLRDLNTNLKEKVEEQTREIRASYEIERNAHLELEKVDKAKNQFIMITQHHLRTPITSIKWQLESIIAGTYGNISTELKKALGDMAESIERLNHLINSLLSISALKAGIETLIIAPVDIGSMIDEVISELHKEIDRKKLNVEVSSAFQPWPKIPMDKVRMQEVLFIIIENSVKYNIEEGKVMIGGKANESRFELTVENTGQELSSEDRDKIFSELFYRSAQAQIAHPTGMGIGLTMAQAIIEAHRGTISISSRRAGGGVKVVITLPY